MSGRIVHLGLGAFARAHSIHYTHLVNELGGERWGVTGFTGTKRLVADQLNARQNRYHLVTRHPDRDDIAEVDALDGVHRSTNTSAWVEAISDPATSVLTITVTEKGYRTNHQGELDVDDKMVMSDVQRLRTDRFGADVVTAPGRLAQAAFIRARSGVPLTVVSCDNLAGNGAVVRRVILDMVEAVDGSSVDAVNSVLGFSSSMVDRITPATTAADIELVQERTLILDEATVVTEPFTEWVLEDTFVGPRPRWEAVGVSTVDTVDPYERRKLLLLNGAHSILAYTGLRRGLSTVATAMADPDLARHVETWWSEAAALLPPEVSEVGKYTDALRSRFANPRIEHRLAQISQDGSAKLRVRIVPVITAARSGGRRPPPAAVAALAAWIGCWMTPDIDLPDPRAENLATAASHPAPEAARRLLAALDPSLASDEAVVAAVLTDLH
jgi:fructuronate reductase